MDVSVIGFKIWYADGTVEQSMHWRGLTSTDIVVIMTYQKECFAPGKHYRIMTDGCDWYWWDGKAVQTVRSKSDSWQDPPKGVKAILLKKGVMVSDDKFARISKLALADLSFDG